MRHSWILIPVLLLFLPGCGPSAEEQRVAAETKATQARLDKAISAARKHFGIKVKAGNWGTWPVSSITGEVGKYDPTTFTVSVKMDVPPLEAREIIAKSIEMQRKIIGWNACPSRTDEIWAAFGSDDQLIANPAISGTIFTDIDCRREGL